MDQNRYKTLVNSLEVDATINPTTFRSKVLLISSTAYIVLFGLLAIMIALFWFGFSYAYTHRHTTGMTIRLGLFALVMLPVFFVVLRMFFMRLSPPEGRRLNAGEAPKLFSLLDKMRKKLGGPPIHHVMINEDYNAAIMQRPRWGLFGGHTNYLILGLPYMLGVPPKEMLATVAHEYGHLCGSHGKVSAWVYRQRRTFGALFEQVSDADEDNWVHKGFAGMLEKFMPYYNAHTFVLSRQNEYEADMTATKLAGAKANASGLVRDALLGRWIHETFWPGLYKQADTSSKPAFLPYSAMRTAFRVSHAEWATRERLAAAWSEPSDLHDTHPALRERVEAIGEEATLPDCVEMTAAEALLGSTAKVLIEEFDRNWWAREKDGWQSRRQHVTRSQARLAELSRQSSDQMALQDLQEYAMLSVEFAPPQEAKSLLEKLLRRSGGPFPRADYHYGCLLLKEGSERGLDHLSTAAGADRRLIESVARTGYGWLHRKYGDERAQDWWDRIVALEYEETD